MVGYTHNKKLLIHVFQYSLIGAADKFLFKVKRDQIFTLRDLARAFLEQYKHMLDTVPDQLTLQGMKKGSNETYREYAVKWKNAASLVQLPLINWEENSIFVDILPSPYYDMLVGNVLTKFVDLLFSVGRIEDRIKRNKIMDTRVRIFGKRRNVLKDHVRGQSKRKFKEIKESIGNLFHSSPHNPRVLIPSTSFPSDRKSVV